MAQTYTLRQAAQLLGISLPTLRRRVTRGEIIAHMTPGPYGERWEIERELVLNLLEAGEAPQDPTDEPPEAVDQDDEALHLADELGSEAPHEKSTDALSNREALREHRQNRTDPLHAYSRIRREAPEALREQSEAPQGCRPEVGKAPSEDPNEALHRGAHPNVISDPTLIKVLQMLQETQQNARESNEEARRLERQSIALQYELQSYRRALGEQAQSLVEKEALLEQTKQQTAQVQDLEELNKRQAEQFQDEKAQLCEQLKLAQNRVEWFEHRVPRWVRKVLRIG
jgi:excisionase family DNA binding protein